MRHQTLDLLILAAALGCAPAPPEPIDFGGHQFVTARDPLPDAGAPDSCVPRASAPEHEEPACLPVAPNLLRNPSFEHRPNHACGWNTFDSADWGIVAAPYCVTDDHPGCALYLASEVWGEHWVAQFSQDVNLEPGGSYVFSFEAKAAGVARPLLVSILSGGPLRDGAGNLDLGAGIEIELTTEWRTYTFEFVSTEEAADSVVDFGIGGADTGLYLDNVMLAPAPPPLATSRGEET